jgi:hypothetical protein
MWEYMIVDTNIETQAADVENRLDRHGEEGWELILILPMRTYTGSIHRHYLKRLVRKN